MTSVSLRSLRGTRLRASAFKIDRERFTRSIQTQGWEEGVVIEVMDGGADGDRESIFEPVG